MTPSNRKAILDLAQFGDVVLLFCSLGIAYSLIAHRDVLYLLTSLETHRPIQVFTATLILGWAWHVSLNINGFYGSHRLDGFLKESIDACSGTSLCALFSAIWLGFVCFHSATPPWRIAQGQCALWVIERCLLCDHSIDCPHEHACASL